jgi:N-hydroxyarylamine O-acetyltransferase
MSNRNALAAIASRWISLWCAPVDWSLFRSLHADDFEDRASAGRAPTRDGFSQGLADLVRAFPDLQTRIEDVVIDEAASRVAVRWSATGTNRERFLGIGPTNRRTALSGIEIIEVRDGWIVRRWGEWDTSGHRAEPMSAGELVARYLDRLGVTARGLAELHLAHLLAVPFENLSIHSNERIHLDIDWLFDKLVTRRRGGFCYELNGLFAELLRALGHRVDLLAARVVRPDGTLGIPFDHMCLRVDDVWLADVGFGDNFIAPLRLDTPGPQHDGRRSFRIVEDGGARFVEDSGKMVYAFDLAPHALADFAPGCEHHQTSPDSHFTRRRVVSRLLPSGRITLRDDRLITTDLDGAKTETAVGDDWRRLLAEHFGIA